VERGICAITKSIVTDTVI